MKKRITALLLCLVMAFSLIPTTVWADTCTAVIKFKVIPVYEDSSKNLGYDVDYDSAWVGTLPCTYTSKHSTNANHSIQIKGFHPSKMGWTVRTGYEWTGWAKTVNLSVVQKPTFSTYYDWSSSTSNFNGTGTHYVYMIYGSKTPTIPQPNFDTIFNNETVRVTDLNTTDGHGTKTYPLMADRYTSVKNSDTQYTITVLGADYIKDYKDSFPGVTHTTVDGRDKTIILNYTNNTWVPTPANVTFTVECEPQPVAPNAPSDDQVSVIQEPVMVDCVTPNRDAHGALPRPFISGTWARNTEKGVYESNGDYYFDVTITNPVPYVNEYNGGFINGVSLAGHTYTETGSRLTVTLKYNADTKTWQRSQQALVNCECEADLPIPTDEDIDNALKGRRFLIQDVVSTNAHSTKVFSITDVAEADRIDSSSLRPVTVEELQAKYPDKNYTSNPYKTENGEILYYLTVADAADLDPYIDLYNNHEDIGVEHKYRYHSYTSLIKTDTGWELYDSYISRVAVLCDPVPAAPSGDDLEALLKGLVNVDCSLLKEHDAKTYDTVMDTLKSSALTVERGTDGSFFCSVELDPAKLDTYVEKYSSEFIAPAHEADVEDENTDLTVKLIWNASAKKWAVAKDDTFTIITKCQLAPAAPDLTDLDGAVIVNCVGAGDHGSKTYALKEGTYTLDWVYDDGTPASQVRWDTTANTWRYDVLMCGEKFEGIDGFAPYVADFNKLTGVEHDRAPYSYDGIILLWEEGHWTDDQSTWIAGHWYVDEAAYVGLTCSPAAPTADMLKYLVSVEVSCKTKPAKHDTRSYDLTDGYFSAEVYEEDGVYFCRVTLNKTQAKYYVNPKFSKDEGINKTHKLKAITNDTVLLVWYEKPLITMLDNENDHNGRWVLADQENSKLTVTATCRTTNGGDGGSTTTETKTVKSGKTFDAGIAMYVGLGILSVTGSAVVIRKKKEF